MPADVNILIDFLVLEEGSNCIYLSVILIDSVFKIGKNCYSRMFLECKYIVKEKEATRHITKELEISSDEENSDGE